MELPVLGSSECNDPALTGAKAAHLSRLATDYRVPPGFVIPAQPADVGLVPAVWDATRDAYRELGSRAAQREPLVAVRSSALDEDGMGASFAGQHATHLGVLGEAALRSAIEEVLASASSPSAHAYRAARGVQTEDVRIAVLVQQLVVADVSAVAFSMNTVTGDRDEVVINSSWGLGEPIVSGTVTPDTYLVSALEFTLLRRDLADKATMLVVGTGGLETVGVPGPQRLASSLTTEQAIAVARLASELEARMGWPADVECAWQKGTLYLLQCRPITTVAPER
jgi:phosphoenolpyruvate synthase/pyruvate phosphate dikinase